jgi:hypothetical protein
MHIDSTQYAKYNTLHLVEFITHRNKGVLLQFAKKENSCSSRLSSNKGTICTDCSD